MIQRRTALFISMAFLVMSSHAQTVGAIAGLQRSVWRTAGESLAERNRLELGVFLPFQLHTNFVIRNELSLAIGTGGGSDVALDQLSARSMIRFYPEPRVYVTGGLDVHLLFGRTGTAGSDQPRSGSNVLDLTPFLGGGMRVSERSEIGIRAGVGVLAKIEIEGPRIARDHQLSLIYTHAISGRLPGFSKRRLWRRSFRRGG